jgi:uncharacterized protein YidB (DUF937 family)
MTTNDPMGELGNLLGGLPGGSAEGAPNLPPELGNAIGGLLGGGAGGTAGLENLVKGFQDAGLGDEVASWIGSGPNKPVSPDQIGQALGPEKLQQLSSSTGIGVAQLLPMLAAFLPQIINALTPNGQLPSGGSGANPMDAVGDLLKGLGG